MLIALRLLRARPGEGARRGHHDSRWCELQWCQIVLCQQRIEVDKICLEHLLPAVRCHTEFSARRFQGVDGRFCRRHVDAVLCEWPEYGIEKIIDCEERQ